MGHRSLSLPPEMQKQTASEDGAASRDVDGTPQNVPFEEIQLDAPLDDARLSLASVLFTRIKEISFMRAMKSLASVMPRTVASCAELYRWLERNVSGKTLTSRGATQSSRLSLFFRLRRVNRLRPILRDSDTNRSSTSCWTSPCASAARDRCWCTSDL